MTSPSVLVVDDSDDYRRIVARVLSTAGYKSIPASSAEEAREILAARTPDAAILDWNLPGESGVEFARWLRREPRFSALPVLLLSVNARTEEQIHGLRSGEASGYMTKPFEPAELVARLHALIPRRPTPGSRR